MFPVSGGPRLFRSGSQQIASTGSFPHRNKGSASIVMFVVAWIKFHGRLVVPVTVSFWCTVCMFTFVTTASSGPSLLEDTITPAVAPHRPFSAAFAMCRVSSAPRAGRRRRKFSSRRTAGFEPSSNIPTSRRFHVAVPARGASASRRFEYSVSVPVQPEFQRRLRSRSSVFRRSARAGRSACR